MMTKLPSGAATGKTDKNGSPICVHQTIADSAGAVYYVNSYCQAVPRDDGAATDLADLIEREHGDVRVLSADELLSTISDDAKAAGAAGAKKQRRPRRKAADTPASSCLPAAPEVPAEAKETALKEKPAEDPVPNEKPAEKPVPNEKPVPADIPADMALVLQAMPDRVLAEELHRRGYVFTAVKPVILTL